MAYPTFARGFRGGKEVQWGAATLAFLGELWVSHGSSWYCWMPHPYAGGTSGRTNATNPGGNLVLYRTELDHQPSYQVTPPEDVEHVTRISRKGRGGEDWTLYHRDYIARWEARAEYVITGSRAHTPRHAPSDYMRCWVVNGTWLSASTIGQPYTHHPQTHIGWRLDKIVTGPCSLPLLEGAIVGGDESHASEPSYVGEPARERAPRQRRARRRPTAQMTTRVEDYDEVPAVPESTVLHLPREQTPDTEPSPPFEQPLEQPQEEPSRHPPIRRIYTRRQKKAIGAPEPSSAL
ncbi:hypothetical protein H6P81_003393 [Aristolochia fimbriata]|uniref:Uncharacterized protein n=1 Tax=Aristolochia fimbriata TaxID=158543 RepID=A0AAV7FCF7_ARIFI|nr:hypothetical protein H6P81_003393 [Aristolochia fimbriata]